MGTKHHRHIAIVTALAVPLIIVISLASPRAVSNRPGGHDEIACSQCHQLFASVSTSFQDIDLSVQCKRCHKVQAAGASDSPLTFHDDTERSCLTCHSFHHTEQVSARGRIFSFDFTSSRQQGQCFSCHGANQDLSALSSGHRRAAQVFHSDSRITAVLSPSEACLICHSQSRMASDATLNEMISPRFEEHGSHPVGMKVRAGSGQPGNRIRSHIDGRIALFGGKIECQSCHSLSSSAPHRLVAFENESDLCRSCHEISRSISP